MANYINFYLKKKPKEGEEAKNEEDNDLLLVLWYSGSNNIYQIFNDTIHIPCTFNGDEYTELTQEKMQKILDAQKSAIEDIKRNIKDKTELLHDIGYNEEYVNDILSSKDWLRENEETMEELNHIAYFVKKACYLSDFESIMMKITC